MTDIDCSICYEAITAATGKSVMSCGHEFHMRCLVKWLQQPTGAGSCPCCRKEPGELENVSDTDKDGDESTLSSIANTTPLMDAIQENRINDFLEMLHNTELIHMADSNGDTALHYAVFMNSTPMVTALLEAGINPNHQNNERETELMYASANPEGARLLALLLDYGAKIDLEDEDGWTALQTAAFNNNLIALNLLLERGARGIDIALHRACENDAILCAKALLDSGVDVNCRIGRGRTPLMNAVANDASAELVDLLLEHGARIHDTDDDGWNAFMWLSAAERSVDSDVMASLLQAWNVQWIRQPSGQWARVTELWGESESRPPPLDLAELTRTSATRIQAAWRGYLTCKRLHVVRDSIAVLDTVRQFAATKIQTVWRGWLIRTRMRRVMQRIGDHLHVRRILNKHAANKIQAVWRGSTVRSKHRFLKAVAALVLLREGDA